MKYEITRGVLGKFIVHYECPECECDLNSDLMEAGKPDTCPECEAEFTVPGEKAKARYVKQQAAKKIQLEEEKKARQYPPSPRSSIAARQGPSALQQIGKLIFVQLTLVVLLIGVVGILSYDAENSQAWTARFWERLVIVGQVLLLIVIQLAFWLTLYSTLVYCLSSHAYHLRRATYFFIWLGPPIVSFLGCFMVWMFEIEEVRGAELTPTVIGAAIWMLLVRRLADWVAPYLTSLFLKSVPCPGCGERFPLVGQWNCSCGYHDHKQRHLMRFRCPLCQGYAGHFNCQRCDVTILC